MGKVDNNKHIVNSSDGKSGRSGLNVMLRLIGLVKPLAGYMAVAILMGLAGHLCASFITIFGGYAILDVSGYDTGLTLGVIFVCVIVFALVRAGFRYAEQSCNHFIAFKLLAIIRDKVFRALRKLCPARLEGRDRGDLISIITSDIELLEVFYAHTISPIAIAVLYTIIMCCYIGSFHWSLALIALIAYICVGVAIPLIASKASGDDGLRYRTKSGELSSFVLESLRGASETIQYGNGAKRLELMNGRSDDLSEDARRMKNVSGVNTAVTNVCILVFDIIMLLAGVENGYQGALMAPTEILAQQHYNNLQKWLTPMGISVGLFLGSQGKKVREKFRTDLLNGQMNIAVGTHALIQEGVDFNNLGAIVVDEQHRFGVKQRNVLKKKSQNPQILTMTATPIPRTLALTVHGDLDLTVIDELPKGRKPIKTSLVTSHKGVYDLIRHEIEEGRQAYVVYPLIEESETLSAKAATIEAERLQNEVFPQFKIGLLHGKLKNDEKDKVMADFKDKKYDILVSTTVVEVGVDVPNATVMLIENAERFGLSQLHQLRGRVGRSDLQSYCILHTSTKSQETRERLNIMTQTNDGFVIAEKDLQIRGPGEFLGTRQSGLPDLVISDIVRDAKILEMARNEAIDFVKTHKIDNYPALKKSTSLSLSGGLDI